MFIQVIQGQVGDAAAMRAAADAWVREVSPGSYGWLGTTAGVAENGTMVAVVRFESRHEAQRNSERPEQAAWWQETEKLFTGEVTFRDCERCTTYMGRVGLRGVRPDHPGSRA